MISRIKIKNFKSFGDEVSGGELALGKINVIYGANNSGKSSIFQAIWLLKQSINRNSLNFRGDLANLESFINSVFLQNENNEIEIGLTFEYPHTSMPFLNALIDKSKYKDYDFSHIELVVSANSSEKFSEILSTKNGILYKIYYNSESDKYIIEVPPTYAFDLVGNYSFLNWSIPPGFKDSFETEPSDSDIELSNSAFICRRLLDHIQHNMENIFSLSTSRRVNVRAQSIGSEPLEVTNGRDTLALLQYLRNNQLEIFNKIVDHTKKFDIADLTTWLSEGTTTALFRDNKLPVDIKIMDIGFGTNQIFSVIVQCFAAPENSTILIEEPEIHLHPLAQAKLLDLFRDATKTEAKQIIVTTHSAKLLQEIRRNADNFEKNEMKVFEVTKGAQGSVITPILLKDIKLGGEFGI